MNETTLKAKFWIDSPKGVILGRGRLELLKQIQQTGSISKAAKAMEISYRKAWRLAQSMNEASDEEIVIMNAGGSKGGGTKVSEKGLQLMNMYESFDQELSEYLKNKSAEYSQLW